MKAIELEELLKKRLNVNYNTFTKDIEDITSGIIFMYSNWSPSIVQLRNLISSLENYPEMNLYVFNIDEALFSNYRERNKIYSDGWGETFWIKNGQIISSLKKYNSEDMEQLLLNNYNISI